LLRISSINCRSAKLRRIYIVDFPLCGLDFASKSVAFEVFSELRAAGHSLVATDCDPPSRACFDQLITCR
jgi:ABC-type Mn2+/Zn2+ transport system ATPase subunit